MSDRICIESAVLFQYCSPWSVQRLSTTNRCMDGKWIWPLHTIATANHQAIDSLPAQNVSMMVVGPIYAISGKIYGKGHATCGIWIMVQNSSCHSNGFVYLPSRLLDAQNKYSRRRCTAIFYSFCPLASRITVRCMRFLSLKPTVPMIT